MIIDEQYDYRLIISIIDGEHRKQSDQINSIIG